MIAHLDPARALDAMLREDLLSFALKAAHELSPGQPLPQGWYLGAIAHVLELCLAGEIRRLIINVPPRHLKSVMASVALPAFALGRDPAARIVCASYSAELAGKHARDCRRVMNAGWYQGLFPATRIGREKNTELDFVTTRQGYRLSTSVGGTLTGRGGTMLIVDDPIKPDEALSEVRRSAAAEWYDNTLYTRLDDKSTGCIIIVMQRLHMDDLVGHVLSRGGGEWTVLSLPAIAEADALIRTGRRPNQIYQRRAGELLDPRRENAAVLASLRENLGGYNFSAQYQQQPIPVDGEIFKAGWFQRYETAPAHGMIVQSWDTAMKDTQLNDYSVCTTWRISGGKYYLLDVYRQRLQFPALVQATLQQQQRWQASAILIEDKGSGTSLAQSLRTGSGGRALYPQLIEPEGDKVMRASAQSPLVEAGRVLLPQAAAWLDSFMREVLQFPNGKHDDQVDSVTQFLGWASKPRGGAYTVKLGGI